MSKLALIALVVLALCLTAVAWSSTAKTSGLCGHHRRYVDLLAERGNAAVYVYRDSEGIRFTELCDSGRTLELDLSPEDVVQKDSVVITARDVGFASESCSADEGVDPPCVTVVSRLPRARGAIATSVHDPTLVRSEVTRVSIGRSGVLAWISCHRKREASGLADPNTERVCLSSGRRRYVYVLPPAADPDRPPPVRRLTSGTKIDPHRLSVRGDRVQWWHDGRVESRRIGPTGT